MQEPIEAVVVGEAVGQSSITSKLQELQDARAAGLLTEAEFAQARGAVLENLTGKASRGGGIVSSQPRASLAAGFPKITLGGVHPKAETVTGPLMLVRRGSPMQCVVEDAEAMRAGHNVTLNLASHPGKGIGKKYPEERRYSEWRYTESDINSSPVSVCFESGNFIKLSGADLVFDVSFWKFKEGTIVNFVGGNSPERTRLGGGGRDWTVHDDGSISLTHHPQLVLGTRSPPGVNNYQNRNLAYRTEGCFIGACVIPVLVTTFGVCAQDDESINVFGVTLCFPWCRHLKRTGENRFHYTTDDHQDWDFDNLGCCMWGSPGWCAIKVIPFPGMCRSAS